MRLPSQRSAEQDAVEHDEQDRLWLAVDTLNERCQRLLRIVAFEHRPDYSQVAAALDMPVGSIGPTRSRCLAKLRSALVPDRNRPTPPDHQLPTATKIPRGRGPPMTRDRVFDELEAMWTQRDPMPEGLVERMQAVAAAEVALADTDLDYELMLLIERSTELAGTRGTATAYTLRFSADGLDLLVRARWPERLGTTRLDGWIVPPAPLTVRATQVGGDELQLGGRDRRARALRVRGASARPLPLVAGSARR